MLYMTFKLDLKLNLDWMLRQVNQIMCSHFDPVLDPKKLETYFKVEPQLPLDLKNIL